MKKVSLLGVVILSVLLLGLLWNIFLQTISNTMSDFFEHKVIVNLRPEPIQSPLDLVTTSCYEVEREYRDVYVKSILMDDSADYILGSFNRSDSMHLLSIDAITREVNWEMPGRTPVAVGSSYVYVTSSEQGTVMAYEKVGGKKIWENNVEDQYPVVSELEITPLGLLVTSASHTSERYHLLDLETGEPIASFQSAASKEIYFIERRSQIYVLDHFDIVVAKGENQWQTSAGFPDDPYNAEFPQIQVEEEAIMVYQRGYPLTQVTLLDKVNGAPIWHTAVKAKSNFTFSGNEIFFVSDDTKLNGGEMSTRQWTQYVAFSPDSLLYIF